jgi:hypothetical protein
VAAVHPAIKFGPGGGAGEPSGDDLRMNIESAKHVPPWLCLYLPF